MPTTRTFVRSWHGGIVAPQMLGRIDSVQFQAGAADVRNFLILPQGVLRKRPGFVDSGPVKSGRARLVEFDAGPDDAIILELGVGYVRFWRNGVIVQIPSARAFQAAGTCSMSSTTGLVTQNSPGHTHADGDPVVFSGGTLPPELTAGTVYYVTNSVVGSTFRVAATPGGTPINFSFNSSPPVTCRRRYLLGDTVSFGGFIYYCYGGNDSAAPPGAAYPSGTWHRMTTTTPGAAIYEVPSPYTLTQLRDINYDQVNDIVTMAHQDVQPMELRRYGDTYWTLTAMPVEAGVLAPTGGETKAVNPNRLNIQSITMVSPAVFTMGGPHGFNRGDGVYVRGTTFTTATSKFGDGFYLVHDVPSGGTTLQLKRYDNTVIELSGLTLSTAGQIEYWPRESRSTNEYKLTSVGSDTQESGASDPIECFNRLDALGARNMILWDDVPNAKLFKVYKRESGVYGYIGEVNRGDGPQSSVVTWSFAASGTQINWTDHPFKDNEPFRLTPALGSTLPTGTSAGSLSASVTYYVRSPSANSFYFSTSPDLAYITGGSGGTNATATQRWFFNDDLSGIAPDLGKTPPERDIDELTSIGNYPGAVGHYQQRKVLGGSANSPQTFITSRPGTENDFSYRLPQTATDRLKWEIAVRRRAEIRHILPLIDMVVLTSSGEVRVRPVNSEVLGPNTTESIVQTHIGCSRVRPQLSQQTLCFVSARSQHVNQLTGAAGGFGTEDMSLRASHLFDGHEILESAQLKGPYPIDLWLRNDGVILACTYVPSERLASWHILQTDGIIESIAVGSEATEDRLYCLVQRTVNGSTVRRVEYMAPMIGQALNTWVGLDAASIVAPGGSATISGLTHLEGLTVGIVADGQPHPPRTVVGGQVVLQSDAYTSVVIGRQFEAYMDSLPMALQVDAYAQGRPLNVTETILRVVETAGSLAIGPMGGPYRPAFPNRGPTEQLRTEDVPVTVPGLWQRGGRIRISHADAMPCQVTSMVVQVAIGD
jgi:hypothetical protein